MAAKYGFHNVIMDRRQKLTIKKVAHLIIKQSSFSNSSSNF